MASRKAQINRVLLILRTTGSGRELLQGALQYARSDPYCSVQMDLMPDALTPEKVAAIRDQGIDGILTSEIGMTPAVTAAFAKLDIPMVVMSAPDPRLSARSANLAFVGVDEEGIGAQGAKYLASLGIGSFNAFGFVASYKGLPWSDLHKKGFIDTVESFDKTARVFSGPANLSIAPGSSEDLKKLETWLLDIPKPAAIMADHDTRASQIIDCCKRLEINIPRQIALIGVDNDRVICASVKLRTARFSMQSSNAGLPKSSGSCSQPAIRSPASRSSADSRTPSTSSDCSNPVTAPPCATSATPAAHFTSRPLAVQSRVRGCPPFVVRSGLRNEGAGR